MKNQAMLTIDLASKISALRRSPFLFCDRETLVAFSPKAVRLFSVKEQVRILGNLYYYGLLSYEDCVSAQPAAKEHIDFIDEFY